MGEVFVVADLDGDLPSVRLSRDGKAVLQIMVARTEYGELAAARDEVRQTVEQEVETLLRRQPGHRPEQRRALALIEPEPALQHRLCRALADEHIPAAVGARQDRIVPGIPDLGVDAVQNAG